MSNRQRRVRDNPSLNEKDASPEFIGMGSNGVRMGSGMPN